MDPAPVSEPVDTLAPAPEPAAGGGCPFPHQAMTQPAAGAAACPIDLTAGRGPVHRSPADMVVRRILRIRDTPEGVSSAQLYRSFQRSMLISAIRCTLTYVVFPFLLPAFSFVKGVGPVLGVIIGSVAMVCDVFTIRRFFVADHKYRWPFSIIAFGIMCLLAVLLVQDVVHIVTHI